MKKHLLPAAVFAAFIALIPAAGAQQGPTLTSAALSEVGDKLVAYSADSVGIRPGSAGADNFWDFSNLKRASNKDSVISEIITPASTPYAADFPNATGALKSISGQTTMFFSTTGGKEELLGYTATVQSQTIKAKYVNTMIRYTTPMSYTYTHDDTYSGGYNVSGVSGFITGDIMVQADAYGTVKMPGSKTYNNVLRIHAYQRNKDSVDYGFVSSVTHTTMESWSFVMPGRKEPIITITHYIVSSPTGTQRSKSVTYNNEGSTVGIMEGATAGISALNIYPNPSASGNVNVSFTQENSGAANIEVINQLGQLVKQMNNMQTSAGANTVPVSVEGLSKGIYFVKLQTATGSISRKLVLE